MLGVGFSPANGFPILLNSVVALLSLLWCLSLLCVIFRSCVLHFALLMMIFSCHLCPVILTCSDDIFIRDFRFRLIPSCSKQCYCVDFVRILIFVDTIIFTLLLFGSFALISLVLCLPISFTSVLYFPDIY